MSELTLYKGEVFDFIDSPLNRKDAYRYFSRWGIGRTG